MMRIALTAEEQARFDSIPFDGDRGDFRTGEDIGEAGAALMRSLVLRRAIPRVRLRYFIDPELNPGVGKSRQQVFMENGFQGREIVSDPCFVRKYLRYFVLGPALPPEVVAAFQQLVAGPIRELEPLRELARAHAREPGVHDGEEFFKLSLECGLELREAEVIRTAVLTVVSDERRKRRAHADHPAPAPGGDSGPPGR
jgi:hypothetical protein